MDNIDFKINHESMESNSIWFQNLQEWFLNTKAVKECIEEVAQKQADQHSQPEINFEFNIQVVSDKSQPEAGQQEADTSTDELPSQNNQGEDSVDSKNGDDFMKSTLDISFHATPPRGPTVQEKRDYDDVMFRMNSIECNPSIPESLKTKYIDGLVSKFYEKHPNSEYIIDLLPPHLLNDSVSSTEPNTFLDRHYNDQPAFINEFSSSTANQISQNSSAVSERSPRSQNEDMDAEKLIHRFEAIDRDRYIDPKWKMYLKCKLYKIFRARYPESDKTIEEFEVEDPGCFVPSDEEDEMYSQRFLPEDSEIQEDQDFETMWLDIIRIHTDSNLSPYGREHEKYNAIKRFREAYPNTKYEINVSDIVKDDSYDSKASTSSSFGEESQRNPQNQTFNVYSSRGPTVQEKRDYDDLMSQLRLIQNDPFRSDFSKTEHIARLVSNFNEKHPNSDYVTDLLPLHLLNDSASLTDINTFLNKHHDDQPAFINEFSSSTANRISQNSSAVSERSPRSENEDIDAEKLIRRFEAIDRDRYIDPKWKMYLKCKLYKIFRARYPESDKTIEEFEVEDPGCFVPSDEEDEMYSQRFLPEDSEIQEDQDFETMWLDIIRIHTDSNLSPYGREREKYNAIKRFREAYPNTKYEINVSDIVKDDSYDSKASTSSSFGEESQRNPQNQTFNISSSRVPTVQEKRDYDDLMSQLRLIQNDPLRSDFSKTELIARLVSNFNKKHPNSDYVADQLPLHLLNDSASLTELNTFLNKHHDDQPAFINEFSGSVGDRISQSSSAVSERSPRSQNEDIDAEKLIRRFEAIDRDRYIDPKWKMYLKCKLYKIFRARYPESDKTIEEFEVEDPEYFAPSDGEDSRTIFRYRDYPEDSEFLEDEDFDLMWDEIIRMHVNEKLNPYDRERGKRNAVTRFLDAHPNTKYEINLTEILKDDSFDSKASTSSSFDEEAEEELSLNEDRDYTNLLSCLQVVSNDPQISPNLKKHRIMNLIEMFEEKYPNTKYQVPSNLVAEQHTQEDNHQSNNANETAHYSMNESNKPRTSAVSRGTPHSSSTSLMDSLEELSQGGFQDSLEFSQKDSLESSQISSLHNPGQTRNWTRENLKIQVRNLMLQQIIPNRDTTQVLMNDSSWFQYSQQEELPGHDTILERSINPNAQSSNWITPDFSTPKTSRPKRFFEANLTPVSPRKRMRSFVEGTTQPLNASDSWSYMDDSSVNRWRERKFPILNKKRLLYLKIKSVAKRGCYI